MPQAKKRSPLLRSESFVSPEFRFWNLSPNEMSELWPGGHDEG